MPVEIQASDELVADLHRGLDEGAALSLLTVFRVERMSEFTGRFGYGATRGLLGHILSCLPESAGRVSFYQRSSRPDHLAALIGGRLDGVERGLRSAASVVEAMLGLDGIALGFGTALLPYEGDTPDDALALADRRIVMVGAAPLANSSVLSPVTGRPLSLQRSS